MDNREKRIQKAIKDAIKKDKANVQKFGLDKSKK